MNETELEECAKKLYSGLALAPMVRASTTPLRTLALEYGADFVYTEEMVDRSISCTYRQVNDNLKTIDYIKDPSSLSKKALKKLQKDNNRPALLFRIDPKWETNKLVCQIGTGEPELALPAATHIYKDVSAIDINMGCPKKFSVSGGMGSALLSDPDRASRIIKTLRNEIPRPISCKIRLLKDTAQTIHFMEGMIQTGRVHAMAIHARRVGQDATDPADWKTLKEVLGLLRPKYPTFPFLVNGDFYTQKDIDEMLAETSANGVLLGRPALYNTSMFQHPNLIDKTTIIQEFLKRAVRYDAHYKNAKYVICEMMNNRRAPPERVPFLPQVYPGKQTIAKTCNCHSIKAMCEVWNINWSTLHSEIETKIQSIDGASLEPGEHRYEDSYFLRHEKNHNNKRNDNDQQSADNYTQSKRPRLDDEKIDETETNLKVSSSSTKNKKGEPTITSNTIEGNKDVHDSNEKETTLKSTENKSTTATLEA